MFVIEFSLNTVGRGGYQEYSNYQMFNKNTDEIVTEIESCQPAPELIIQDNKVVIHMTYMMGEDIEQIIKLTNDKLVLVNGSDQLRTYKKLK